MTAVVIAGIGAVTVMVLVVTLCATLRPSSGNAIAAGLHGLAAVLAAVFRRK